MHRVRVYMVRRFTLCVSEVNTEFRRMHVNVFRMQCIPVEGSEVMAGDERRNLSFLIGTILICGLSNFRDESAVYEPRS